MKEYHNDLRIHMLITRLPYIKLQYLFWNYNDMDARDIKKKNTCSGNSSNTLHLCILSSSTAVHIFYNELSIIIPFTSQIN